MIKKNANPTILRLMLAGKPTITKKISQNKLKIFKMITTKHPVQNCGRGAFHRNVTATIGP